MPFDEFFINDFTTLVLENEVWSLYVNNIRDKRSIEEILDTNGNARLCKEIRDTILKHENPFESEPILEEPKEELVEVEGGDGEILSFKKPNLIITNIPEEIKKETVLHNETQKGIGINDKSKDKEQIKTPLLDTIHKYVGSSGVLELFGETRGGKSRFCMEVAREAINAGKTVYFLDTEDNNHEDTVKELSKLKGLTYKYTPDLDEINKICADLPKVDLVVVDSIGFPMLVTFAKMSLNKKGNALLNLIATFGDLKLWAYHNKGIVLVTNQPESEFNKDKDHIYRPFGDKSQFAVKEIWKTSKVSSKEGETKISIKTFGSRIAGMGTPVINYIITNNGVKIE